ncbi:haloalkane dehalogenase [Pseudaestuariivita rosea]|uniref:haloalkane dehalogenase n=1 Tax=Pseudaestuariivita rosea TaxID=2763263 RepID=UPI001ABA6FE9|nr:haloalkane dehalogenase [Pseudaestuariivita rosea]
MGSKTLFASLGIAAVVIGGIGTYAYRTFLAPPAAWDRSDMRAVLPSACIDPMEEQSTPDGVAFVRTPAACFAALPDWPYDAQYVEIDGLRQGYVEAGPADGEIILMLHGQPSWAYLYRFMIPVLAERGYRVIAMDHLGFGTSDKPVDPAYHSFTNHANRLVGFIDALALQDITLFAQDWGSIIGLYVAGGDLDRFDRMIIGNGGLPIVTEVANLPDDIEATNARFGRMIAMLPPNQPPFFDEDGNSLMPVAEGKGTDPFGEWVAYARFSDAFQPSTMVEALTFDALTDAERAAYDAPYPSEVAMAGPRTFPGLRNELVGITADRKAALETYTRPFLTIFGANDPGLVGEGDGQPWMMNEIPGAQGQPHQRLPETSHFLQDDRGAEIAEMVDAFIRANP